MEYCITASSSASVPLFSWQQRRQRDRQQPASDIKSAYQLVTEGNQLQPEEASPSQMKRPALRSHSSLQLFDCSHAFFNLDLFWLTVTTTACLSVHAWGFTLYAARSCCCENPGCSIYYGGSWTGYKYPHASSGWSVCRYCCRVFFSMFTSTVLVLVQPLNPLLFSFCCSMSKNPATGNTYSRLHLDMSHCCCLLCNQCFKHLSREATRGELILLVLSA